MPIQLPKDRTVTLDFREAGPLTTKRVLSALEQVRRILESQGHVVKVVQKSRREQRA